MAKRRKVLRVKPFRHRQTGNIWWELVFMHRGIYSGPIQSTLIDLGRKRCREYWDYGTPAQLVVHGRNGKIRFENTYGNDPRRYKG